MLYAGVALGILGGLLGTAISVAALVGAILGRAIGASLSAGTAAFALLISVLALAGGFSMFRYWRKASLLTAACGALGLLALPDYYIAPAIILVLPSLLYATCEIMLRRRASKQVCAAARAAMANRPTEPLSPDKIAKAPAPIHAGHGVLPFPAQYKQHAPRKRKNK